MLKKTVLQIEIECGEKTCVSETGVFCNRVETTHFGTRYQCGLFRSTWVGGEGAITGLPLKEDKPGGSLLRCKPCLEAEVRT